MRHVDLPGYQHFDLRRFRESGSRFIYLGEKFAPAEGMVYHPRTAALHGIYLVALASVNIQGVSQVYIKIESHISQKFKI